MKNITAINFPNNVSGDMRESFTIGKFGVTEIRTILKNGEMASINWFQIVKGDEIVAEIKESVCDVFGYDKVV